MNTTSQQEEPKQQPQTSSSTTLFNNDNINNLTHFTTNILPIIDTFIFDVDSTVFNVELLDEFATFCNVDVVAITNRAMNGEISFARALVERIEIISLNPHDYLYKIATFLLKMRDVVKFTPHFVELLELLYERKYNVYFVSGGFKIFIVDLLKHLLPPSLLALTDHSQIYANHFTLPLDYCVDCDPNNFDIDRYLKSLNDENKTKLSSQLTELNITATNNNNNTNNNINTPDTLTTSTPSTLSSIVSVDTTLFTAQTQGKARVLDQLRAQSIINTDDTNNLITNNNIPQNDENNAQIDNNTPNNSPLSIQPSKTPKGVKNIIMIGDGVTDLQAKPPAIGVIGYGGIIARKIVLERADWFIYDYQLLIEAIKAKE